MPLAGGATGFLNGGLKCDDFVYNAVMGFARHVGQQLEVETQTDRVGLWMLAQKTVIIALSAPQPVAVCIESHSWNYNQVEVAGVRMVLWFGNMEIPFRKCHIFS